MRTFEVYPDYETPAHAGAEGMFQIIELTEDGEDVTSLVDPGWFFSSMREVEQRLSTIVQEDVEVEETG